MKRIYIIFIFLLLAYNFFGDVSSDKVILKISINNAVKKALENNLSIKNSKLDYNSKLLSVTTSWNQFVPNASLSSSIGKRESTTTQTIINNQRQTVDERVTTSNNSLSAGFDMSLGLSAKNVFSIYQAVIDYKSGVLTYEQAKQKLTVDIKKAYYNLLIMQKQTKLKEKQIDSLKNKYEFTLLKYNNKMINEVDKLKAEYSYKTLIPDFNDFLVLYKTALLNFKANIGVNFDNDIELTDNLPEIPQIDFASFDEKNLNNNYDIKIQIQKLQSDLNSRNTFIAQLFPSISLSYSLGASFNKDFTTDSWFSDMNNWNTNTNIGFSVNVPIGSYFPFSSVQTGLIKGQFNAMKTQNDLDNLIMQKKISLITILMKLKQITETIDSLKTNREIADKTYSITNDLFTAGNKDFMELQDAQNNQIDANIKIISAENDFLSNYFDLEILLNTNDTKK